VRAGWNRRATAMPGFPMAFWEPASSYLRLGSGRCPVPLQIRQGTRLPPLTRICFVPRQTRQGSLETATGVGGGGAVATGGLACRGAGSATTDGLGDGGGGSFDGPGPGPSIGIEASRREGPRRALRFCSKSGRSCPGKGLPSSTRLRSCRSDHARAHWARIWAATSVFWTSPKRVDCMATSCALSRDSPLRGRGLSEGRPDGA